MAEKSPATTEGTSPSTATERSGPGFPDPFDRWGEWFERWPDRFTRRWPDLRSMPFVGDDTRLEQYTDDDGTMVIRAELPGIDPDTDVTVTVDEGRMTVSGHREERSETRDKGTYRSEFRYGSFERTVSLPAGAVTDEIEASYEDGILEVRVPVDADRTDVTTVPVTKKG